MASHPNVPDLSWHTHAFGIGFSIDDVIGIGFFCSGILTSLLNIPALIIAISLSKVDKADEWEQKRELSRFESVQAFSLPFLLIVSGLLVGLGVVFSVLIVAGFLAGPPGASDVTLITQGQCWEQNDHGSLREGAPHEHEEFGGPLALALSRLGGTSRLCPCREGRGKTYGK